MLPWCMHACMASWLTSCRPWSCCSCVRSSTLLSCSRCSAFCRLCLCSLSTRRLFSKPSLIHRCSHTIHCYNIPTSQHWTLTGILISDLLTWVCPGESVVSAERPPFPAAPFSCLCLIGHFVRALAPSSAACQVQTINKRRWWFAGSLI